MQTWTYSYQQAHLPWTDGLGVMFLVQFPTYVTSSSSKQTPKAETSCATKKIGHSETRTRIPERRWCPRPTSPHQQTALMTNQMCTTHVAGALPLDHVPLKCSIEESQNNKYVSACRNRALIRKRKRGQRRIRVARFTHSITHSTPTTSC